MKFLVFSDSHGKGKRMLDAVALHQPLLDGVIFLGDGARDIQLLKENYPELCVFSVRGNCDFGCEELPNEEIVSIGQNKVLLTHGHLYSVKYGTQTILEYAVSKGCQAVFFGHTHEPYESCEYVGEHRVQILNPGSIGAGNYAIVQTDGKILVNSLTNLYETY